MRIYIQRVVLYNPSSGFIVRNTIRAGLPLALGKAPTAAGILGAG